MKDDLDPLTIKMVDSATLMARDWLKIHGSGESWAVILLPPTGEPGTRLSEYVKTRSRAEAIRWSLTPDIATAFRAAMNYALSDEVHAERVREGFMGGMAEATALCLRRGEFWRKRMRAGEQYADMRLFEAENCASEIAARVGETPATLTGEPTLNLPPVPVGDPLPMGTTTLPPTIDIDDRDEASDVFETAYALGGKHTNQAVVVLLRAKADDHERTATACRQVGNTIGLEKCLASAYALRAAAEEIEKGVT